MEPEDQFAQQAAELFREQIVQFSRWLAENWAITEKDNESYAEPFSDEYMRGFNAALEAVPEALTLYLDAQ